MTNKENCYNAANYYALVAGGKEQEADAFLEQFSEKDQYLIVMVLKKAIANAAADGKEEMRGKCYECKYRGTIPGDAHSKCTNPYSVVIGDPHGVKNGWFLHPFNFDPNWLIYCDSFEQE